MVDPRLTTMLRDSFRRSILPTMKNHNSFGGPFLAVPTWAVEEICRSGAPSHLQVLTGMVSLMERRTREVEASLSVIADHVNLSRETTKRSIKWLREAGILSVARVAPPAMNVYVVEYTRPQIGSPVTLLQSSIGSPMTLWPTENHPLEEGDRVTGDPIKTPETLSQQGFSQTTIEVIPLVLGVTEVLDGKEGRSAPVEVTMIIGADPDDEGASPQPQRVVASPKGELKDIVGYFIRHPQVVMSRSFSLQEVNVVRRSVKLLQQSGLSRSTIRMMIDQFYSTDRFRTADRLVYIFANKAVQQELLAAVGGTVQVDDPVLQLMLADFVRGDEPLPWPSTSDSVLHKAVITNGMEACYRYPELVAALAISFSGQFDRQFRMTLANLNDLIIGISERKDYTELKPLITSLSQILTLPKELASATHTKLRDASDTISEAVYKYRRLTRVL